MAVMGSKAEKDLEALKSTVQTVVNLVVQLQHAIRAPLANPASTTEGQTSGKKSSEINVLELSNDAAKLLKAHSTKISLLIINKPFTATAITTVLREIAAGPLPSLASATELCDGASYTKAMAKEMQWRVEKVLNEFAALVREVPLDGKVLSGDQKNGTGDFTGKGSLASTGLLWKSCDDLMALKTLGVAGLAIKKAEEYRDTLKDALEELEEWGEEEDDEDNDDEEDDEDVNSDDEDSLPNPAQQAIDDMFDNQRHIPRDDTNKIRERLESSLKRLKLINLMYQAIVKRRFKSLPALPRPVSRQPSGKLSQDSVVVQTLDEVLNILQKIPDITDELANGFYELDTAEIDKRMDEVFLTGFAAAELLMQNWEGQKDEFTAWAEKFQNAMKKGW